jgi:hypothetical protein
MKLEFNQANKQARVLAKHGSHQIYNTIPKSKEWFTINFAINVMGGFSLTFYISKGERL